MRNPRLAAIMVFLVAIPLAGCATTGTGEGSSGTSGDVLTRDQLADLDNLSAYDAIVRLKPIWVRSPRYSRMRVYVDGIRQGRRDVLRNIQTRTIQEIRFLDPRRATMEFGTGHEGGALLITTRS